MRVTLGGTYGSPPRQMFRCVSPDGSSHRFAGTLPRLIADGEVCQHCDNEVHRHQGPLLTRDYEFHLRLAARALLDVGNGLTCTEAAARARATAVNPALDQFKDMADAMRVEAVRAAEVEGRKLAESDARKAA